MRSVRFKGLRCSFVVVSRSLLCFPAHYLAGRSIICPRGVGGECRVCPGLRSRWVGFCAIRSVLADGNPGELELLEAPESLLRLIGNLELAVLQGEAFTHAVHGVAVIAARRGERRPWDLTQRGRMQAVTGICDSELFDAVGRLFGLPADPEAAATDFDGRYRSAVEAKHALSIREHLSAL